MLELEICKVVPYIELYQYYNRDVILLFMFCLHISFLPPVSVDNFVTKKQVHPGVHDVIKAVDQISAMTYATSIETSVMKFVQGSLPFFF